MVEQDLVLAFTLAGSHAWWDRAGVRHNSWRGTKYYHFNGQVVAMRKNGVLSYLHGDHLGSTVLTTNGSGNFTGQDLRHAYGRQRGGTELGTENRFTAPRNPETGRRRLDVLQRPGLKPQADS